MGVDASFDSVTMALLLALMLHVMLMALWRSMTWPSRGSPMAGRGAWISGARRMGHVVSMPLEMIIRLHVVMPTS
jgi:hypothetical protein